MAGVARTGLGVAGALRLERALGPVAQPPNSDSRARAATKWRRANASRCSSSSASWSAQLLGSNVLARGGFDQWRATEEDRAGAADDDRLVAHRGRVRAAGGRRAHDQ